MKRSSIGPIALAACLAQAAPVALAAAGGFAAASAPHARHLTQEQREEWRFLKDAAASSRFGAEAARLALARSGDANLRALAAALVNHHAGAQAALTHMLHVRNMAPPMLSSEQRKTLNRLAKLQGAAFDRAWMADVGLRAQQDDLATYERALVAVNEPRLHGWIERTLPAVRWQLATAERTVTAGAKFAKLAPTVTSAAIKSPAGAAIATRAMGAGPLPNPSDLGEGNMVLGPAQPVDVRLTRAPSASAAR